MVTSPVPARSLRRLPEAAALRGMSTQALRKRILRQKQGANPRGKPIHAIQDELGQIWVEVDDVEEVPKPVALSRRVQHLQAALREASELADRLAEDVARLLPSAAGQRRDAIAADCARVPESVENVQRW
jgi:hypothetical protein